MSTPDPEVFKYSRGEIGKLAQFDPTIRAAYMFYMRNEISWEDMLGTLVIYYHGLTAMLEQKLKEQLENSTHPIIIPRL